MRNLRCFILTAILISVLFQTASCGTRSEASGTDSTNNQKSKEVITIEQARKDINLDEHLKNVFYGKVEEAGMYKPVDDYLKSKNLDKDNAKSIKVQLCSEINFIWMSFKD